MEQMDGMGSLHWLLGRIQGLAGTVRYDMPDALRAELREVAERLDKAIALLDRLHAESNAKA